MRGRFLYRLTQPFHLRPTQHVSSGSWRRAISILASHKLELLSSSRGSRGNFGGSRQPPAPVDADDVLVPDALPLDELVVVDVPAEFEELDWTDAVAKLEPAENVPVPFALVELEPNERKPPAPPAPPAPRPLSRFIPFPAHPCDWGAGSLDRHPFAPPDW